MPATDKEIGVVALHEQFLEIPTPGGQMKTFVTRPQKGGPFAPIVIYMDIWGVREELYDIARRVATVGYCCFVPDLYYRLSPGPCAPRFLRRQKSNDHIGVAQRSAEGTGSRAWPQA
jgi:dienelactone hydrolase